MIKQFALSAILFFTLFQLHAQTPVAAIVEGTLGKPYDTRLKMDPCPGQSAGTIAGFIPGFDIETNDLERDTLYLCIGDQFLVDHNGDFSIPLPGDPNPSTPGSVSYAFYTGIPTIDGPNLATIATDPNIILTETVNSNDPNVIDTSIQTVIHEAASPDVLFFNNGALQAQFNNGQPVVYWFAPVTIDRFNQTTFNGANIFIPAYEDDPAGPCVTVAIDQAFAVAYLNPIASNGIQINPTDLSGSFELGGGLPQLDGSSGYTITITQNDDPSIKGTITSGVTSHAQRVEFTIPEVGLYTVTVEDDKSCPHSFEINFVEGIIFEFTNTNIPLGGSGCIDLRVRDFVDVSGLQLPLTWDPLALRFDSIVNLNPNLLGFDVSTSFNLERVDFGELRTIWADLINFTPVTLADNDILFSLCFTARASANEGECSTFMVDLDSDLDVEINAPNGDIYPFSFIDGQICISSDPFLVTVTQQDIACTGNQFGTITFTPENGVAPYRYELLLPDGTVLASGDNIQEGETVTIDMLTAETYDLVVFDQTSNPGVIEPFTREITIISGNNFGVSIDINFVPISCNGLQDGAIRVIITENGVAVSNPENLGYSFIWNTGDTTAIVRDIGFGDYSVTVTKDGCTKPSSASVSQPPPINIMLNGNLSQDAVCEGINNGILIVDISGGATSNTNTYGYIWEGIVSTTTDPFDTNIAVGGLGAGTYNLTVTDDNGCEATDSYVVAVEKELTIDLSNFTDITCFGGADGEISITANTIGGTEEPPYSFAWEGDLGNVLPMDTDQSSTLSGVGAGTFIVTLRDNTVITAPGFENARCTIRDTFTITEPERIVLDLMVQDATCNPTNSLMDGRAELAEPIGGTAPFTYTWDSLPNVTGRIADNLTPGEYTILIQDANNCQDSVSFSIGAPELPVILGIETDTVNCSSDTDGQLTVLFQEGGSGGVVPESNIIWSNNDRGSTTSATLSPGEYTVRITDTNSCFAEATGTVVAPNALQLDSIRSASPSCPGFTDGEITVFVSGGTGPYSYTNTINDVTLNAPVFSSLSAGTYTFLVEDTNNCPPLTIADIEVEDPPSIVVTFTDVQGATCDAEQGACDGRATATAVLSNGEQRTFDFQWIGSGEQNFNTTRSTAIRLCPGMDSVLVTNDGENACTVAAAIEITSPPKIQPFAEDVKWVSCAGEMDGSVTIGVLGGTPDFRYVWNHGANGNSLTGLTDSTYSVVVIDANDCRTQPFSVFIGEPDPLVLSVSDASQQVTCAGDEDGFIQLRVIGGNGLGGSPFNWSGGVADVRDSLATDLAPGIYFATVVDQNGCTDSISYSIGEPSLITADIPTPAEPVCFGEQTSIMVNSAMGGAGGPYSFGVNTQAKRTLAEFALVFGGQEHTISVFDIKGCSFDTTIFINQPPPVEIILPSEIEVQLGDSIRLRPDVSVGDANIDPGTITWTPSDFLSTTSELNPFIRPFESGNYTLTLSDLKGCMGEASVFIDVDKKRNVYIPNAIAPASIRNSRFEIQTGSGVRQVNFMRVYDRWGELIYEMGETGPSIGGIGDWDGTFRGKKLPMGVYVYIIEVEFEDNITLLYRGDVTVIY